MENENLKKDEVVIDLSSMEITVDVVAKGNSWQTWN